MAIFVLTTMTTTTRPITLPVVHARGVTIPALVLIAQLLIRPTSLLYNGGRTSVQCENQLNMSFLAGDTCTNQGSSFKLTMGLHRYTNHHINVIVANFVQA